MSRSRGVFIVILAVALGLGGLLLASSGVVAGPACDGSARDHER